VSVGLATKGHPACKKMGVGLLVVMIRLELCTSYISCCQHHHLNNNEICSLIIWLPYYYITLNRLFCWVLLLIANAQCRRTNNRLVFPSFVEENKRQVIFVWIDVEANNLSHWRWQKVTNRSRVKWLGSARKTKPRCWLMKDLKQKEQKEHFIPESKFAYIMHYLQSQILSYRCQT